MDVHDAGDMAHLAVLRSLLRSQVTEPIARSSVLTELCDRLLRLRDEQAQLAHECGASYAEIGRAMGISRQAARARFTSAARASGRLDGDPSHEVSRRSAPTTTSDMVTTARDDAGERR